MKPHLTVNNLQTRFKLDAGLFGSSVRQVHALNGVSLQLMQGENYGIVGESGSGKTTLAKTISGIFNPHSGDWKIHPADKNTTGQEGEGANGQLTGELLKYVFQDPASSLNPRMTVESVLTHGYRWSMRRNGLSRKELNRSTLRDRAAEALESVGIPSDALERRPSDFSGGQRQRISLARALMFEPEILICDEVVSALDVSIQSQILNLLVELKQQYRFSMLFIAHDLLVVSYLCDRVGVMNGGFLVEEAAAQALLEAPLHPYTRLLYDSMPLPGKAFKGENRAAAMHDATIEPAGCPFAGRCPLKTGICSRQIPELQEVKPGHRVACFHIDMKGV